MKLILIYLFALLFLISCSPGNITMRYYMIETPQESMEVEDKDAKFSSLPYSAEVRTFNTPSVYDQIKIVLRTNSNEINYYYYHQWAELPSVSIKNFIANKLKDARVFETLFAEQIYTEPDYLIMGEINSIERVNIGNESYAHFEMTIHLIDFISKKTILSHSLNKKKPISETAPMNIFAMEISNILNDETELFIQKVYDALNTGNK